MDANKIIREAVRIKTIVPAFNIPYLPMMKPVTQAITEENAVAMIQVARLEWEKFKSESLEKVAEEYGKYKIDGLTMLHLDHVPVIDEDHKHVDVLPIIERAIKAGYGSVMIDASRLSFLDNAAATKEAADVAHAAGVYLEAELGAVAGHESGGIGMGYDELFETKKGFTDIDEAARFAKDSGCDWLSVAVGSVHGAIAENTRMQKKPEARLDIGHIAALSKATGGMPLVLHGGSGVRREYILTAVENGVAKINIGTDIRQPYERALDEKPGDISYAAKRVYEKTRWLIREFLNISENRGMFASVM